LNFLAHIFLSGDDDQLMIGNFIADFVKGKKKDLYPERIKKGIELHRMIDDFTDHHPVVEESKKRLRSNYGKYSGVIVDLYHDHFLAANFHEYSQEDLTKYSSRVYITLQANHDLLPEGVQYFLPFMIERNWLLNYATVDGIGRALTGLGRRVSFPNKMDQAVNDLRAGYDFYLDDFNRFFPQLITFAKENS
jgi:acyl carrier protein phosphodiesterase